MLKAVIFDMDGTLVDSEPIYLDAAVELFREFGLDISDDEHAQFIGTSIESMWRYVREKYSLDKPLDMLVDQTKQRFLHKIRVKNRLVPMPGVVPLIGRIKEAGLPVAIGTSTNRDLMEVTLELYGLAQYFPIRVTVDDAGAPKPSPNIFLMVAKLLSVEPEHCLVFEDSFHGSLAAKRAEMKCVGYTFHGKNPQDLSHADLKVDDYSSLTIEQLTQLF